MKFHLWYIHFLDRPVTLHAVTDQCCCHSYQKVFSFTSAVNIWVAFGSGTNFSLVHINKIYRNLGKEKSMILRFFHSCTGCDITLEEAQKWLGNHGRVTQK